MADQLERTDNHKAGHNRNMAPDEREKERCRKQAIEVENRDEVIAQASFCGRRVRRVICCSPSPLQ